jgi:hypothetical protein
MTDDPYVPRNNFNLHRAPSAAWRCCWRCGVLILGKNPGSARISRAFARVDIGERLPIGVTHLEATKDFLNGPLRREPAVGHPDCS